MNKKDILDLAQREKRDEGEDAAFVQIKKELQDPNY